MTISENFIEELKAESASTQKIFSIIPFEKALWKPHEKSMELARLVGHIAEIPEWITLTVKHDDYDFDVASYKPFIPGSVAETLDFFNTKVEEALIELGKISNADLEKEWRLSVVGQTVFSAPRYKAIRQMSFNHLIHHRAQLTVYLRILNVALPSIYGPTADDRIAKKN